MDHPVILKGISHRTLLLSMIALLVISVNAFFDWSKGLYLSSLCSVFGALVMLIIASSVLAGYKRYINIAAIILFNILFIGYTFLEGLSTGAYLYFFPLILVMTFMLIDANDKKNEILYSFMFTILSFCICIFLAKPSSKFQYISVDLAKNTFIVNSVTAILLCAVFAYIAVVYDTKMKHVLVAQRNKTNAHADKVKQQNIQLKEITFITAHSVRAPLSNILGLVHLLQNKELSEEEKLKMIGFLHEASQSLDLVLRDVIEKSKQIEETLTTSEN